MNKNRRNYYRILQVQPEAPEEIIKASYRALMTKLRCHPDLGGDHETAVLINEAYATLIDPKKRATYDRSLNMRLRPMHPGSSRAQQAQQSAANPASSNTKSKPEFNQWSTAASDRANEISCNFCGTIVRMVLIEKARCKNCGSPVAPLHRNRIEQKELNGRRLAPRVLKNEAVILHANWQSSQSYAQLINISPIGLCVITATMISVGQVIRVIAFGFEAVAKVVSCRRSTGNRYAVHMNFLSVVFGEAAGTLISISV